MSEKYTKLTPTKGRPKPPSYITGEALAQWNTLCDELDQMGTLTIADTAIIALMAVSTARYIEAEAKVKEMGPIITSVKNVPYYNPWLSVSNTAHDQIIKLAKELGLTPWARSKIKIDKEEAEADDFAELDS